MALQRTQANSTGRRGGPGMSDLGFTYKSSLSTSRVNCILQIEMIISIAKLMM
jgi:hypothetical protein